MAKLFLESTDTTYKVSSANTKVYGATGDQVVTVDAAATGVTFDANVEGVSFSGATSDFTYKQLGLTDLGVYKAGALYATVAIQDDATGSLLTFSNGTVATKFATTGGVTGLTFGGTAVSATTAATVTPATIDTTTGNGSTSTPVTGSTFTLTTGVDQGAAFTGGDANDTFNGTGATLGAQDVLNGGAGKDTLKITDTTKVSESGLTTATFTSLEALEVNASGGVGRVESTTGAIPAVTGTAGVITITTAFVGTTAGTITLTYGGLTYTSSSPTVTTTAEAVTAIAALVNTTPLGRSATVTTDTGTVTITAKALGQSLPTISIAGTMINAAETTASIATTAAVTPVLATGAQPQIQQITIGGTLQSTDTYTVNFTNNSVTNATLVYTGNSASTAATSIASQINALYGSAIATAVGSVVTINGGVGTVLPNISVTVGGTTPTQTATSTFIQAAATASSAGTTTAAAIYDASGFADSLNIGAQGDVNLKAASTATVNVSTTSGSVAISGGATVTALATTGVSLSGSALTTVDVTTGTTSAAIAIGASSGTTGVAPKIASATIKGGSDVLVTDYTSAASSSTLKSVTISGTTDTTVTLQGDALTTLNVGTQATATAITITNSAVSDHNLTLVVADSGKSGQVVTVADNTAKSVALTANGTSNYVKLDGDASLVTVTTTGAASLNLDLDGSNNGITSFDGSASTGALTLTNVAATTVSLKTGSGNDTLTTINTAKATINTGAGNDKLTINATLAAGSSVQLGAGDDKLLKGGSGTIASSTTTDVTLIDAGAGADVLSASFVTAGNGAQFANFETLGLDLASGTLDASLITTNTISGLELLAGGGTYTGINTNQNLVVASTGISGTTTLTFNNVTGESDSYSISFAEANAAARTTAPVSANVDAGTVVTAGVENISIGSGGSLTWNTITLGANTDAEKVTVTGAANLDLAFASNFGSINSPATGVTLIDGSTANGKLAIDLTNVVDATAGIAVKGGSAADTITVGDTQVATLTGGAGVDTFNVWNTGSVFTGTATLAEVTSELTAITDLAIGEKIDFESGATTVTLASTPVVAKTNVSSAVDFLSAVNLAAVDGAASGVEVNWFVYGGNTYLLYDASAAQTGDADTGDILVKLSGVLDLTNSTLTTSGLFTYVA